MIDGTGAANQLLEGETEAPCVLEVAPADLQALLTGQMNPLNAFLSGKVRVRGDLSLALQLQKLFARTSPPTERIRTSRRRGDSNSRKGFCRPVPDHSATSPLCAKVGFSPQIPSRRRARVVQKLKRIDRLPS